MSLMSFLAYAIVVIAFIVATAILCVRMLNGQAEPRKTARLDTAPTEEKYEFVCMSESVYFYWFKILEVDGWNNEGYRFLIKLENTDYNISNVYKIPLSAFTEIIKVASGGRYSNITLEQFYMEYEAFILEQAKETIRQYDKENKLTFLNEV